MLIILDPDFFFCLKEKNIKEDLKQKKSKDSTALLKKTPYIKINPEFVGGEGGGGTPAIPNPTCT